MYQKQYWATIQENIEKVNAEQMENIKVAASLMADAIQNDKLINVYGGGGHTTLCMGEMFFRAGGLSNINPIDFYKNNFVGLGDKYIWRALLKRFFFI